MKPQEGEAREAEAEVTCPIDCVREVRNLAEFERVLLNAESANQLVQFAFASPLSFFSIHSLSPVHTRLSSYPMSLLLRKSMTEEILSFIDMIVRTKFLHWCSVRTHEKWLEKALLMFLCAVFNSEQRNRCRRKSRIPLNKRTTMFVVLSSVVFCSFPIIGRLFSETLRIESLQLVCISARAEMDMRKKKSRISLKRQTANFHCLSSVSVLQFSNCREVLFSQTSTIRVFAA